MTDQPIGARTDLSAPATRADFEALDARLHHIDAQIETLRAEMAAQKNEYRIEHSQMRAEFREGQAQLRAEFRAGIAEFKLGTAKLVDAVNRLNASRGGAG